MIRLRLLGGFGLEGPPGHGAPAMTQLRAQAVLAVLAVSGELGCTRERLLALLWPEADEEHARRSLRDVVYGVRAALGADAVVAAGESLRLNPSLVSADVREFADARRADRPADAVRAYGGALLEGIHVDGAPGFERWLDGERGRLAREHLEALEQLAERAESGSAWAEAVGWWARAVEQDPVNSRLVLRHAGALAAVGDRANAVKAAEAHVRRIREELDVEPDPALLAEIDRIRRGQVPAARRSPSPEAASGSSREGSDAAESRGRSVLAAARGTRGAVGVAALVVVVAGVLVLRSLLPRAAPVRHPRTAVAVLPFRFLGADSSFAFLAEALQDQLLTDLQKVSALEVTGRISVMAYERTTKSLRRVADELDVGSVVEGSVEVANGMLQVNVQLLDVETQKHRWAERYVRRIEDVMAVQNDVVQRIVEGLGAQLTAPEAGLLAAAPTRTPKAYEAYLQGLAAYRRGELDLANLQAAERSYQEAIALDPGFAEAHAGLAVIHHQLWCLHYDPSPERAERQRAESRLALRLAPDLPEAHEAAGLGHWCRLELQQAKAEFNLALRGAPGGVDVWKAIGLVYRELGQWDSMDVAFTRAVRLDPGDAELNRQLSSTYWMLRRYPEAIRYCRGDVRCRGWIYAVWKGDLDTIGREFERASRRARAEPIWLGTAAEYLLWKRQPDTLLAVLRDTRETIVAPLWQDRPVALYAALAYQMLGDSAAARASFASALAMLDSMVRQWPYHFRTRGARGLALAGLGRRRDALRDAAWLAAPGWSLTPGNVADFGTERAYILALAGETDSALAQLDRLLAGPAWKISVPILRIDPRFDRIRGDPRFAALLARHVPGE